MNGSSELVRLLLLGALTLGVLAGLVWLAARAGLPLGRLPGDFSWTSESGSTRVYVPLTTMLLASLVLTLLLNVLWRIFR